MRCASSLAQQLNNRAAAPPLLCFFLLLELAGRCIAALCPGRFFAEKHAASHWRKISLFRF
jgi:hypothetical protein